MLRVIFEVITGVSVSKDGEAVSVLDEPRDSAKQFRSERELATSPRMGPSGQLDTADSTTRNDCRPLRKSARVLAARGIEIDVGEIIGNGADTNLH